MTKAVHCHKKIFPKKVHLFTISAVLLLFTFGCGTTTPESTTEEQSISKINKSKDIQYRQAIKFVLEQDSLTGGTTRKNASI